MHLYTPEEKEIMYKVYLETKSIKKVQKVVPAAWVTIQEILIKKGIYSPMKYRRFTDRDKKIILDSYKTLSYRSIAKKIKRTPKAVTDFLKTKGLYARSVLNDSDINQLKKMASEGLTMNDAAEKLGLDYSTVNYHKRKKKILFKEEKKWNENRKKTEYKSAMYMTDEDKKKILAEYKKEFNLTRTCKHLGKNLWTVRSFLIKEGIYQHKVKKSLS